MNHLKYIIHILSWCYKKWCAQTKHGSATMAKIFLALCGIKTGGAECSIIFTLSAQRQRAASEQAGLVIGESHTHTHSHYGHTGSRSGWLVCPWVDLQARPLLMDTVATHHPLYTHTDTHMLSHVLPSSNLWRPPDLLLRGSAALSHCSEICPRLLLGSQGVVIGVWGHGVCLLRRREKKAWRVSRLYGP